MAQGLTIENMTAQVFYLANTTRVEDDSDVDTWFMMARPWPVFTIALLYLGFVLRLGPAIMKDRRPLKLQSLLLFYNGAHVVFSVWWLFKTFQEVRLESTLSCDKQRTITEDYDRINSLAWYYLMSKFVELLDTVFFVLRKKQSQVSFLHVYHHTNMAIFTWAFLKYVREGHIIIIGCVNSAVHAVMYSYYMLAALGPEYNRFLWIKQYITWMQMSQFVILIGYLIQQLACSGIELRFTQFCIVNTFSFLLLFVNFYHQTYSRRKLKQQ